MARFSKLGRPPTVWTIPLGCSFADAFAGEILNRHGGDPLALSDVVILLPNRRSMRAMQDAFLRRTGGRASILPVMRPIGEVDEDELVLTGLGNGKAGMSLPPAINETRRQLLLARQIQRMEEREDRGAASPGQAVRLAGDLARLIDQVQIERLDFAGLDDLAPEHFARHWQVTLEFLTIVSETWPQILDATGCLDPAERRNRLLEALADHWATNPPDTPVYAAGSTGTIPATAELLGVIARLENGAVVLPGLDLGLDDESWSALDHTHPQYAMKRLLERIRTGRDEVALWPLDADNARACADRTARLDMAREALRPAATLSNWRQANLDPKRIWAGLACVECPNRRTEAGVIALMLRETLESAGRTAALITADRLLAQRVAAELRRWGVIIDDSAGRSLASSRPAAFMRLVIRAVAEGFAPVAFLSLMKHPLAAAGHDPARFRALVRRWERAFLRGPRPAAGRSGLIAAAKDSTRLTKAEQRVLSGVMDRFDALESALSGPKTDLAGILAAHIAVAEALAGTDAEAGADRLWRGEDGNALADLLAELGETAEDFGPVEGPDYPDLFDSLLDGHVIRPAYGMHPRLQIWGTLEARLQSADRVVLGGLNEASWPPDVGNDPWMSRQMRADFGLPPLERRIGQSAQDFVAALGAREVFLTRATKIDGTPTVASRWLMRMRALAGPIPDESARWLGMYTALDRPDAVQPAAPPAPRPPVPARPKRLSVTQVETWMRDPYALYARHILGLDALDPVDADPGAAERGIIVHEALDRFLREVIRDGPDSQWPGDALDRLVAIGEEVFRPYLLRPAVWAFWWPRFEAVARWFCDNEPDRRARACPLATETAASTAITADGTTLELRAKADRIDRRAEDGGLEIIDYKTGAAPKNKQIRAGYAPQLPLEGLLAARGAFDGVPAAEATRLAFWVLRGTDPVVEIKTLDDPAGLVAQAEAGLKRLITEFAKDSTPYLSKPRPVMARPGDYDHLARVKEWRDSDDGGM